MLMLFVTGRPVDAQSRFKKEHLRLSSNIRRELRKSCSEPLVNSWTIIEAQRFLQICTWKNLIRVFFWWAVCDEKPRFINWLEKLEYYESTVVTKTLSPCIHVCHWNDNGVSVVCAWHCNKTSQQIQYLICQPSLLFQPPKRHGFIASSLK